MLRRLGRVLLLAGSSLASAISTGAQDPIVIGAGTIIDGRGGVQRNVDIVVDSSCIQRVGAAAGTIQSIG